MKKRYFSALVATAASALFVPGLHAQTYELPKNRAEAVITLDFQSDRVPRIDQAPSLSILADGTIIMPQTYMHTQAFRGQLEPTELQELLGFIIEDNQFFAFDSDAVHAKLATVDDGQQPNYQHTSTTVIGVALPLSQKRVSMRDLGQGPQVRETRQLLAVKARLEQLMSIVKLGGRDEARQWLEVANEELAAQQSDYSPFSLRDLSSGTIRSDGSVFVQFIRDPSAGADGMNLAISMTAYGEHQVAVTRVAR